MCPSLPNCILMEFNTDRSFLSLITAFIVHIYCKYQHCAPCCCLVDNVVLTTDQILFGAMQCPDRQKQSQQPAQHSKVTFTLGTENILWIPTATQSACQNCLHEELLGCCGLRTPPGHKWHCRHITPVEHCSLKMSSIEQL